MVRTDGVQKLTERQKEILRLLLSGYDAKSAGRELGISVHTVNEHLREARRHLAVTNSREAARILDEAESGTPKNVRPNRFGMVQPRSRRAWVSEATRNGQVALAGVALMTLVAAAAIVLSARQENTALASAEASPTVVATRPSAEAAIPPGAFTLEVTFDRPMLDGNYSFVQISPETYPSCQPHPQRSSDGRSFSLRCTAAPSQNYEVWFNRPPYMNFKSLSGLRAQPYQLRFSTKSP